MLILDEGHVHRVLRNGRVVGYAGIGEASGYKDNTVVAVGIGLDGRIDAVSGATVSFETTAKIVREQGKHLQRYLD
ncbi:MAG: hypothetical protein ACLFPO_09700 [Spirochaetaceae bacterium]